MTTVKPNDEGPDKKETALTNTPELQTDIAKAQVEIARIQAETSAGWQTVLTNLANVWQQHDAQKANREGRYTSNLTMSILVFLVIIVVSLTVLTWTGKVGGESLLFFLGTLSGSVLMLVAERIKSQK